MFDAAKFSFEEFSVFDCAAKLDMKGFYGEKSVF